ncbi:hypothetical protein OLZ31_26725, partial [Enterobacter asburiae]|nr:hypothetical protein [Enterobacter asburiae]
IADPPFAASHLFTSRNYQLRHYDSPGIGSSFNNFRTIIFFALKSEVRRNSRFFLSVNGL